MVTIVRTTRARIIHLKNDYKEVMVAIEKHLHQHFASLAEDADDEEESGASAARISLPGRPPADTLDPPFAKVNTVVAKSPADEAGLKVGDLIRNFGYVSAENHNNLTKVGECVQGNEGVSDRAPPCARN